MRANTTPSARPPSRVANAPARLQRSPWRAARPIDSTRKDGISRASGSVTAVGGPGGAVSMRSPLGACVVHALEPDLAPEGVDRARTVGVVCARADRVLEDDARVLHLEQAAG